MITAIIWLLLATFGWTFDALHKRPADTCPELIRLLAILLASFSAATLATIVVNR